MPFVRVLCSKIVHTLVQIYYNKAKHPIHRSLHHFTQITFLTFLTHLTHLTHLTPTYSFLVGNELESSPTSLPQLVRCHSPLETVWKRVQTMLQLVRTQMSKVHKRSTRVK